MEREKRKDERCEKRKENVKRCKKRESEEESGGGDY